MGSNLSQEKIDSVAYGWYQTSLQQSCVLPDVGIDESLLKFSGINSNYELQSYSKELLNDVPRYVSAVGAAFGSLNSVPNAVGLGALVISMILELIVKFSTLGQQREDSYAIFRRVFGEEKASSVRDTMAEYVKRHVTFINNNRLLLEELHRLETQLSGHLTILKNSLLYDEQMSSRGFKIWVNGASFHIQMLIHEARLRSQTGQATSGYVTSISALIGVYLRDLDLLLNQYASYKESSRAECSVVRSQREETESDGGENMKLENTPRLLLRLLR
ncbi:hypothetical protein JOB18_002248 [Solea senegalensis]|uniref:Uncharacterized protein n=1 Tax=Solea senegalensis TaxID=28829 RepID=A0AAV6QM85_SOLSE|nr:hypothetical protein JOB18_002248 [Solea senegalensis]